MARRARKLLSGSWATISPQRKAIIRENLKGLDLSGAQRKLNRIESAALGMIDAVGFYLYVILLALPSALGSIFGPAGTTAGATLGEVLNGVVGSVLAYVKAAVEGKIALGEFDDLKKLFDVAEGRLRIEGAPAADEGNAQAPAEKPDKDELLDAMTEEEREGGVSKAGLIVIILIGSVILFALLALGFLAGRIQPKLMAWLDKAPALKKAWEKLKRKFAPARIPGVGSSAVIPKGFGMGKGVAGKHPALMIDGKVYVNHQHLAAQELAGTRPKATDLYGFVELDANGKVIWAHWVPIE